MTPNNSERRIYARQALAAYRKARNQRTADEADARDLITDLCHLLENSGHRGAIDQVQSAVTNFRAERAAAGGAL